MNFIPSYGLAEGTLLVSCSTEMNIDNNNISVGNSYDPELIKIIDKNNNLCPNEIIGEIVISGPSATPGYIGRKSDDLKIIINNREYLKTGDNGYLKNGNLYITGRKKDMIIINGRNFYSEDIEETLETAENLNIKKVTAYAFSCDINNNEKLVILCKLSGDNIIDYHTIKKILLQKNDIKPYAIYIIGQNNLPKTSSGKKKRYMAKQDFLSNKYEIIAELKESVFDNINNIDLNLCGNSKLSELGLDSMEMTEIYLKINKKMNNIRITDLYDLTLNEILKK